MNSLLLCLFIEPLSLQMSSSSRLGTLCLFSSCDRYIHRQISKIRNPPMRIFFEGRPIVLQTAVTKWWPPVKTQWWPRLGAPVAATIRDQVNFMSRFVDRPHLLRILNRECSLLYRITCLENILDYFISLSIQPSAFRSSNFKSSNSLGNVANAAFQHPSPAGFVVQEWY